MLNSTLSRTLVKYTAAGILGALVMASVSDGESRNESSVQHRVILPTIRPDAAHPDCVGLATAYAAAVVALEDATDDAQDAWHAWYDCEQEASMGGKVIDVAEIKSETVSILQR